MWSFDLWMLLAGIWLFLFGMYNLESWLRFLAWEKFKQVLNNFTNNTLKSISTWTIATLILQSSTLVSIITIAFVWAWVMSLVNAIWVIIWANIWTTFTSILVAFIWFGEFSISTFAFPLITIGWLIIILAKNKEWRSWSKLIIGFGLLFLWLDFIKESVDLLSSNFDISIYSHLSLPIFFLVGLILTVIIQSSTAVWMLTLAAINSQIIGFPEWVAIVMWANLGTTLTALIAAQWINIAKKQLAIAHVIFNLVLAGLWWLFFWQYIWFIQVLLWISDPIMGTALVNFLLNFSTALLFAPFLKQFTEKIEKILPEKAIEIKEAVRDEFDDLQIPS